MSKKKQGNAEINLSSPKVSIMVLVGLVGIFAFTQVTLGEIQRQRQQVLGERDTRTDDRIKFDRREPTRTPRTQSQNVNDTLPTLTPSNTTTTSDTNQTQTQTTSQSDTTDQVTTTTNNVEPTPTPTDSQTSNTSTSNTGDSGQQEHTVIINSGGTTTEIQRTNNGDVKRNEPSGKKPEVKKAPIPAAVVKQVQEQTGLNLTADDLKIFYEQQGDQVVAKGETADGTKVELNPQIMEKINERLSENNIKVSTANGGIFKLERASISAETKLPISVNLANNSLIVTTPNGIKTVAVLPDQAIQNMLKHVNVDVVNDISLIDSNGAPTYQISSETKKKLLGIIPVNIKKQVSISAENGDITGNQESPLGWLLDKLSR